MIMSSFSSSRRSQRIASQDMLGKMLSDDLLCEIVALCGLQSQVALLSVVSRSLKSRVDSNLSSVKIVSNMNDGSQWDTMIAKPPPSESNIPPACSDAAAAAAVHNLSIILRRCPKVEVIEVNLFQDKMMSKFRPIGTEAQLPPDILSPCANLKSLRVVAASFTDEIHSQELSGFAVLMLPPSTEHIHWGSFQVGEDKAAKQCVLRQGCKGFNTAFFLGDVKMRFPNLKTLPDMEWLRHYEFEEFMSYSATEPQKMQGSVVCTDYFCIRAALVLSQWPSIESWRIQCISPSVLTLARLLVQDPGDFRGKLTINLFLLGEEESEYERVSAECASIMDSSARPGMLELTVEDVEGHPMWDCGGDEY